MKNCDTENALKLLKSNKTNNFITIHKLVCDKFEKAELLSAKLIIFNKKNCPKNTSEVEFIFKISDYKLKIKTLHQNNEFLVTEFKIIQ